MRSPAPRLQEIDREEDDERGRQHDETERCGAAVIELLQVDHDEQRRDLGFHRQVARDENDRSVLTERAREGEGEIR